MKTLSSRITKWTDTLLASPWSFFTVFILTTAVVAASVWYPASRDKLVAAKLESFIAEIFIVPTIAIVIIAFILASVMKRQWKPMTFSEQLRLYMLQGLPIIEGILAPACRCPGIDISRRVIVAFAFVASVRLVLVTRWSFAGWSGTYCYGTLVAWAIVEGINPRIDSPILEFALAGLYYVMAAMVIAIMAEVCIRSCAEQNLEIERLASNPSSKP